MRFFRHQIQLPGGCSEACGKREVKAVVQEVLGGLFDEREAWREAARKMEEGRVKGKVVLTVI